MAKKQQIVVPRTWRKSGANSHDQVLIRRYQAEGMTVVQIATTMDIDPNCIQNWCDHFDKGGEVGYNTTAAVEVVKKPKKKKKKAAKKKPAAKADDWEE